MSAWVLAGVTAAYVVTAVDLYVTGRPAMALCFAGYAIANIGLIADLVKS